MIQLQHVEILSKAYQSLSHLTWGAELGLAKPLTMASPVQTDLWFGDTWGDTSKERNRTG